MVAPFGVLVLECSCSFNSCKTQLEPCLIVHKAWYPVKNSAFTDRTHSASGQKTPTPDAREPWILLGSSSNGNSEFNQHGPSSPDQLLAN
jgi:hypothetical protein